MYLIVAKNALGSSPTAILYVTKGDRLSRHRSEALEFGSRSQAQKVAGKHFLHFLESQGVIANAKVVLKSEFDSGSQVSLK